jgi:hypothetical protein
MGSRRNVPAEVLDPIVKAYEKFKKNYKGKPPSGSAQFEYEGVTYTLKRGGRNSKYYAVPAWREARDSRNREGQKRNQKIKLSSIEKMMVDNIYEEGSKRNLEVDHDIPIAKGGPSNAPWNLKLRTSEVNGSKGDTIGGNFPSEPLFLDDQVVSAFKQNNAWHKGNNAMSSLHKRPIRTTTTELGGQNLADSDAQTESYINDPYEYTPKGAKPLPYPATSTDLPLNGV